MTAPGTPQVGGQQSPDPQPQQPGTPQAPAGAPQAAPQQMAPQKPAYTFESLDQAVAFANAQLELKQSANAEAKQANNELKTLKQQVDYLVVQQRMAQQHAIAANVQLQAKNLNFRDPDFIYSAISGQLQYDAAGQPTNVQAVLEALKVSRPYLLEAQQQPQGQPPAAQPGQQPVPQAPGQPAPQPQFQQAAQPTGLMNAPQSATVPGGSGGLDWATINANIKNQAWVAQNANQLEAFMANPANHLTRR